MKIVHEESVLFVYVDFCFPLCGLQHPRRVTANRLVYPPSLGTLTSSAKPTNKYPTNRERQIQTALFP